MRTVWTWNAIGKRSGAWNLDPNAPEANEGFLINYLISELLPEPTVATAIQSDPVTGQAAWFDLRVRIEKVPQSTNKTAWNPTFAVLSPRPSVLKPARASLRYGAEFRRNKEGRAQ